MWDLHSSTRDGSRVPCIGSGALTTGPPGKPPRAPSLHDSTAGFAVLTFDTIDQVPAYLKDSLPLASARACLGSPLLT